MTCIHIHVKRQTKRNHLITAPVTARPRGKSAAPGSQSPRKTMRSQNHTDTPSVGTPRKRWSLYRSAVVYGVDDANSEASESTGSGISTQRNMNTLSAVAPAMNFGRSKTVGNLSEFRARVEEEMPAHSRRLSASISFAQNVQTWTLEELVEEVTGGTDVVSYRNALVLCYCNFATPVLSGFLCF